MKRTPCLVLLALVPLGCAGATPAAGDPAAVATTQRPTDVTVVELTPPPPAPTKPAADDPEAEKAAALKAAQEAGILGLIGAGGEHPFGALGASSDQGAMWGDSIGDSFGAGGLGLAGTGTGGGGTGNGTIGLGSIGTLGHGAGTGTGQTFGSGSGGLGGAHRTNPPKVKMGVTTVTGRLPPEIIQRIVRQNFGRFRLCYENGLRTSPKLEGKIVVKFEIDPQGAVSTSAVTRDSTMPDKGVASCVQRAFYGFSFPAPESGKVVVVYPILFSPPEPPPPAAARPATPAPVPAKSP